MMVKDEEKRLPTALASVKDLVDEIVVVDTGSSDKTVEIAKSYGAKVYYHPWEYDFSKHRNQSIQYASGDWLFILDADEELAEESGPELQRMRSLAPEVHCVMFKLYNSMTSGGDTFLLHPRLFRNFVGFHYEGKVHNRPIVTGQTYVSEIKLLHYGYNEDSRTMEAKHQRRVTMIRKWVEEEPESFHARSYLAHALQARSESWPEAMEQAKTGLELLQQHPQRERRNFAPHLYYPLLNTLSALNRDDEARQHALDCLQLAPDFPDPQLFICLGYFKKQQWPEVYESACKFIQMQSYCEAHPEQFVYYENLSRGQLNSVRMRLIIACAQLGRDEQEAENVFIDMFGAQDAELQSKLTVQNLLAANFGSLAQRLAAQAQAKMPQWPWPANLLFLAEMKSREQESTNIKAEGKKMLEAGALDQALPLLLKSAETLQYDDKVLMDIAEVYRQKGDVEQAVAWMSKGLNLHPGHPGAWKYLADYYYQARQFPSAAACYRRYLQMSPAPGDEVNANYQQSLQNSLHMVTVRQRPPKLVLFMINSLSFQLFKQPAPHFLMGKAWGELLLTGFENMIEPLWASLMTGVSPAIHGLSQDSAWDNPRTVKDLKVKSIWELINLSAGFAGVPLISAAALNLPGWTLPGYPFGLLSPEKVRPGALTGLALAQGYRSDFLLSRFDEDCLPNSLDGNIMQEAFMMQQERNKILTALEMPAVDILVIGLNFAEYQQRVHGVAAYNTFCLYQQLYGWLEIVMAALQPENFAIIGQRGYGMEAGVYHGGCYALSWLKGENGQAVLYDIAPEIMKLLGQDSRALGQPR
jgi:tetratricopeptide (TPR) repeat protein